MIPFFTLEIDDTVVGMDFNALVDAPAHMKKFISFSKEEKKVVIKSHFNEEKRIVTGVAIASDLPIYRNDEEIGPHYVVFKAETIKKIAIKMAENGYVNNVNEMHDSNKEIEGMALFESYFVDKEAGIYPEMFVDQNLQNGTWIVSYKVNNDDTWSKIKDGTFMGFSIEGWFNKIPMKLQGDFKGKIAFAKISEVNTWEFEVMEDIIDFGTVIHYAYHDDGQVYDGGKIRAGEYTTPDSKKIQVDSMGRVVMIDGKTKEQMQSQTKNKPMKKVVVKPGLFARLFPGKSKMASIKTVDGLALTWEGDLAEGTEVFTVLEDGTKGTLAPEGDHSWKGEDGKMVVITVDGNGKVTAMSTVDATENTDVEAALAQIIKNMNDGFKRIEDGYKAEITKLTKKLETTQGSLEQLAEELDSEEGKNKKKFGTQEEDNQPSYRKHLKK